MAMCNRGHGAERIGPPKWGQYNKRIAIAAQAAVEFRIGLIIFTAIRVAANAAQ
jgi:hypothetical protein